MLLRVRFVCSAPSTRVQIGTEGQFRQLHYVGQCVLSYRSCFTQCHCRA